MTNDGLKDYGHLLILGLNAESLDFFDENMLKVLTVLGLKYRTEVISL